MWPAASTATSVCSRARRRDLAPLFVSRSAVRRRFAFFKLVINVDQGVETLSTAKQADDLFQILLRHPLVELAHEPRVKRSHLCEIVLEPCIPDFDRGSRYAERSGDSIEVFGRLIQVDHDNPLERLCAQLHGISDEAALILIG